MGIRQKALTVLLSGLIWLISPAEATPQLQSRLCLAPDGLADGAGVWLNMWHYPADADTYCLQLNNTGIRNVFIQTSRSNTQAIANPEKLGMLIDSAHRYKLKVIGWSFAELADPALDAEKLIAAGRFKSPHGEKLDAVAANLEKDLSAPKVEFYSQKLRQELGDAYPIIAVVYSPLNHAPQVANIPWKMLGRYYNVIAPMNYWNSKYARIDPYTYTISTIRQVRQLVGRPDVEVHVIGDGMGTHKDSINEFLLACKVGAATSASLYPNQEMTAEQFECLSKYPDYFPVNSRFRLAAFGEMCRRGELALPEKADPSDAIPRGDFYQLIARQILKSAIKGDSLAVAMKQSQIDAKARAGPVDKASMPEKTLTMDFTAIDALKLLSQVGVVQLPAFNADESVETYLNSPLTTREALDTVALAVEARDKLKKVMAEGRLSPQNRLIKNISSRAGRLFVQPAYAETVRKEPNSGRTLNYFDASQIVVQASAGLK